MGCEKEREGKGIGIIIHEPFLSMESRQPFLMIDEFSLTKSSCEEDCWRPDCRLKLYARKNSLFAFSSSSHTGPFPKVSEDYKKMNTKNHQFNVIVSSRVHLYIIFHQLIKGKLQIDIYVHIKNSNIPTLFFVIWFCQVCFFP